MYYSCNWGEIYMVTNERYLLDIWNKTTELLDLEINDSYSLQYLQTSYIHSINNNKAIIIVENNMGLAIVNNYLASINDHISRIVNGTIHCEVFIKNQYFEHFGIQKSNEVKTYFLKNKLKSDYTFENFVIGNSNVQSQVAAFTCANNPGTTYNPLFIYGNSGLGKTHLLNAIGNHVKKMFPDKKIGLISGLEFVDCVVKSSKANKLDEFKKELYDLDLLLVDDIQFIAGKEKTHEIFFSVFNELVNNRKQICLTSDCIPSEIQGLEDRIISRFNSGLNVNIESPEFETSINILKSKLANNTDLKQTVTEDTLAYIATNFSKDVRSLEGALTRLLFYSINFKGVRNKIDLAMAMDAFKGQVVETKTELNINFIKKIICDYYGLTKHQLTSKVRTKNVSTARHIAMYLSRKHLDLPYLKIGDEFGKRDHSTVMNACEKVEKQIKENPLFQKVIMEIEHLIKV